MSSLSGFSNRIFQVIYHSGSADMLLEYEKVPSGFFERMYSQGKVRPCAIIENYGAGEVLKRLSDPHLLIVGSNQGMILNLSISKAEKHGIGLGKV